VGGNTRKTKVIQNDLNPVWNYSMNFITDKKPKEIKFEVIDRNSVQRDTFIGEGVYKIAKLFKSDGSYSGKLGMKKKGDEAGYLHFEVSCKTVNTFEDVAKAKFYEEEAKMKANDYDELMKALDKSEGLREEDVKLLTANNETISNLEAELKSNAESYKKELQTMEEQIMEKDHLLEGKNREIEDLATELDESQEKLTASDKKIEEMAKENRRLQNELAGLQEKSSSEITSVKRNLFDAEKTVTSNKTEVTKLQSELSDLKIKYDELQTEAAQKKGCCLF